MSTEEIRQFDQDGYLVVRDVLSAGQTRQLREFFLRKFNLPPEPEPHGDTDSTRVDIFSRYPEIRWLLLNERVLRLFKALAGKDFVLMPDAFAALNNFVNWHKDTTAWERHGHTVHWRRGYRMIGFMYYLQDNTEDYGGGLEVDPGTHLKPDRYIVRPWEAARPGLREKMGSKMRALWYKASGRKQNAARSSPDTLSVPSRAGDLLLCHFRLDHRASQPRKFPLPLAHEKICITGGISSNNRRFIQDRLDYYYCKSGRFFPHGLSYPADFVKEVEAHGISFCTDAKGRL
jgi:hypothetical protein